jgi:uncharacterized protein YndB with AHSA1/START domain
MTTTTDTLRLTNLPVMETAMLIRKPVAEVFAAFIDPAITSQFWFTKGSGKLAPGARIRWDWEMYDASAEVEVKAIEQDKRIVIQWSGYGTTTVEWLFDPLTADTTFVTITESGFDGDGDTVVKGVIDSTGGFSFVLAGLKALLEHGIPLNLVRDRHPQGFAQP